MPTLDLRNGPQKGSDGLLASLFRFASYHNGFVLLVAFAVAGSGVFAASPEARQAVYSAETAVQTVDNTYIANADLASLPLTLQVTAINEDADSYYVEYALDTIALVDDAWAPTRKGGTLSVRKTALEGGDLGLYVSEELAEVQAAERARLLETQKIERRNGITQKTVATVYGGLVGRLLDPTVEAFPGYAPVVAEPEPVNPLPSRPGDGSNVGDNPGSSSPEGASGAAGGSLQGSNTDTTPPELTVVGENPVRIALGEAYVDLGAIATDGNGGVPTLITLLNGVETAQVGIDTSVAGRYEVTYRATDAAGNASQAVKVVEVYESEIQP